MENPAYLDSDQSVYESYPSAPAMSQRRPHHLPALHRPPQPVAAHHVQAPHPHRMGTPLPNSAHSTPATTPQQHHIIFPDPNMPPIMYHAQPNTNNIPGVTLPNNIPNHNIAANHSIPGHALAGPASYRAEPLYSCQAPRGHDHVYQCPGHRSDHSNHMEQLEQLEHRLDRLQLRRQQQDEPRSEYQYGGSDYSSTEPIYAQPQNPPGDNVHTPTLAYVHNGRTSLRGVAGGGHGGTPARFLVRADSVGASTSSSTLPTVSALLPHEHAHQALDANKASPSTPTPTKLKRQPFLGEWRLKFLRDDDGGGGTGGGAPNNSRKRACLLLGGLLLLLLLLLGAMAATLYLTLGGGLGSFVGESPKLIQITEKGSKVVTGEFRITNQNFWVGLEDPTSESYRKMTTSIEAELDSLFESSLWSREYNGSEVVSLSPGSLMVRAHLRLKRPDVSAAQKLGSAFLRGLNSRHNFDWLGPFTIDVSSLRFAEVLVDSPSVSTPVTTETPASPDNRYRDRHHDRHLSTQAPSGEHLSVGWGQWGSWSACSPCSPQYDQIRTRQCRLEGGKGLFINSIEPCMKNGGADSYYGDLETRSCQCDDLQDEINKEEDFVVTTTASTTTTTTTVSSIIPPFREKDNEETISNGSSENKAQRQQQQQREKKGSVCNKCLLGEVCVALQDEPHPTCRSARDPSDPTGCGGLCAIDSEVCQALGSRAFNCHSASQCLEDEWRCADGLCIPNIKRCDGHMNCYDQSDELKCLCRPDQFQCGNNTSCLPLTAKCDGNMDCWDGADELNCSSGTGGASHGSTSAMGRNRAATAAMNRTAIGLSSLSHRERELLS